MKQIQKTPEITAELRKSVGNDVNLDNLAVYEAIALNNKPIRKQHPLFNGAIAERSLLLEMAAALSQESRPVQIQHEDSSLPYGRAFYGKVVDRGALTELRVLFFVDTKEDKIISKLDSGTVDQVSVSVLPKQILNSKSGFDYLGEESTAENVWTGKDKDGNVLGKDGVYGRLVGLNQWFELSLVGMGGADGARIVSRDQSYFGSSYNKLAASGVDPSIFLLEASTENPMPDVNLNELVTKLTETTVQVATLTSDKTTLTTQLNTATARITELEAQIANAAKPDEALTAAQTELDTTKASLTEVTTARDEAMAVLNDVAKRILTATGKPDAEVPATVAEIKTLIEDNAKALVAAIATGGQSQPADKDLKVEAPMDLSAFRVNRR